MTQDRGVMYLAHNPKTAVAEVFQEEPPRTIDRATRSPWLAVFALQRSVLLLDLTGTFSIKAGGSMKITSGPRSYSRAWAKGFYEANPKIEGLYFPSSMTNDPAAALNERADQQGVLPSTPLFHRALNDPAMITVLIEIADGIGYRLL
jgi:hypothetical protein